MEEESLKTFSYLRLLLLTGIDPEAIRSIEVGNTKRWLTPIKSQGPRLVLLRGKRQKAMVRKIYYE